MKDFFWNCENKTTKIFDEMKDGMKKKPTTKMLKNRKFYSPNKIVTHLKSN